MNTKSVLGAMLMLCLLPVGARADLGIKSDSSFGFAAYDLFRGQSLAPAGFGTRGWHELGLVPHWSARLRTGSYVGLDGGWRNGEANYRLEAVYRPAVVPIELTAGWIGYHRLNWVGLDTNELVCSATWTGPLAQVYGEAFYDFDNATGLYFRVGARKQFNVGARAKLRLDGSVGFDSGRGIDTWRDASVDLELRWKIIGPFSLRPGVQLVIPSHQVGLYGARAVPRLMAGYDYDW